MAELVELGPGPPRASGAFEPLDNPVWHALITAGIRAYTAVGFRPRGAIAAQAFARVGRR